jgi:hypothetical protein
LLRLLILLKQWRQVCLGHAYRLGHLDYDALVQRELVALLQCTALLPVRIPNEVAVGVIHHDAAVERVQLEEAILPSLLLAAEVEGKEAAEFGDGCRALGRGERRRARWIVERSCHGAQRRS